MSRENLDELRRQVAEESQAHQAAVDAVDETVAGHLGVNRTDLRCLEILAKPRTATPSQLGVALGLTTGSVTAMLDRLERLNYLTRSPDPTDRRKTLITITPEAAKLTWRLYGPIAEEGAAHIATYTSTELKTILRFLRRSRELQQHHRTRIAALPKTPRR